jgi:hypothetical protein
METEPIGRASTPSAGVPGSRRTLSNWAPARIDPPYRIRSRHAGVVGAEGARTAFPQPTRLPLHEDPVLGSRSHLARVRQGRVSRSRDERWEAEALPIRSESVGTLLIL